MEDFAFFTLNIVTIYLMSSYSNYDLGPCTYLIAEPILGDNISWVYFWIKVHIIYYLYWVIRIQHFYIIFWSLKNNAYQIFRCFD